MSDILIKGINLPVGQGVITITIAEDKSVSLATIRRMGGITEILCHTGQGKVVELPPHGRLIDADLAIAQEKNYCEDCDNWNGIKCRTCEHDWVMMILDDAPTVLESSED